MLAQGRKVYSYDIIKTSDFQFFVLYTRGNIGSMNKKFVSNSITFVLFLLCQLLTFSTAWFTSEKSFLFIFFIQNSTLASVITGGHCLCRHSAILFYMNLRRTFTLTMYLRVLYYDKTFLFAIQTIPSLNSFTRMYSLE